MDVTRTYLQVDRPFWQKEGITGMAFTDMSMIIYQHPTYWSLEPDQHSILEGYLSGPLARTWAKKPDDEIVDYTLSQIEKVHKNLRKHFEGGVVKAGVRILFQWVVPPGPDQSIYQNIFLHSNNPMAVSILQVNTQRSLGVPWKVRSGQA